MDIKNNTSLKTLGPKAAYLIAELYTKNKSIFRLQDVQSILHIQDLYSRIFIQKLVNKGIATRLKPGLFILVPFELGNEHTYIGNQFVVAREIIGSKEYYISHGSAMEIHGMLTQPHLVVYITTLKQHRSISIHGIEFRFITTYKKHFWGFTEYWVTKQERVLVSNLERTVIDSLKESQYCGGLTEAAKGLWMRQQNMEINRLIEYAVRMDNGAVVRRLGYLLELYKIGTPENLDFLQSNLTDYYVQLDPHLPAEGEYLKKWRLHCNISSEELLSVVSR